MFGNHRDGVPFVENEETPLLNHERKYQAERYEAWSKERMIEIEKYENAKK